MKEEFTPLQLMLSCFAVAAGAGLAQIIRGSSAITIRKLCGTASYTGFIGLAVGALLYQYLGEKNYILLLGCASLAGLAGTGALDLLIGYWTGGGIQIIVKPAEKDDSHKEDHHRDSSGDKGHPPTRGDTEGLS